jgi:thiol:disulfide interchange protein DsbD
MNAKRGFFLSLVYVLSMSIAYAIAGVLAGLFGSNIQIFLQNPWVITIFSAVFIALAFSMFGFYELQLPRFIQTKISKTSDSAQGKGIIGVAVMGFLSALIVGPCVAAPLAGALIYIGQTGNALLGGFALFIMSLGMGVPLLFVGIGAGKFMPKPGGWMQNVSKIFGVIMLAVAVYLLSRVIPDMVTMVLWALLFIGSSIYLGALEPIKQGVNGMVKMSKVIGVILLIYGIMLFVGAYLGNTNPLNPLESAMKTTTAFQKINSVSVPIKENKFIVVKNLKELDKVLNNSTKPVMVDFSADWCISCKELDVRTFGNPRVKKLLQNFTLIRADVTENSKAQKKMMKKYQVFGPPVMVFFDKNHNQLKDKKLVGFIGPDKFITHIKTILQ